MCPNMHCVTRCCTQPSTLLAIVSIAYRKLTCKEWYDANEQHQAERPCTEHLSDARPCPSQRVACRYQQRSAAGPPLFLISRPLLMRLEHRQSEAPSAVWEAALSGCLLLLHIPVK